MSDDMLSRLAHVIAAAAIQRNIDGKPCKKCGGDPLRPAFDGRSECHAPWPTEGKQDGIDLSARIAEEGNTK